MVAEPPFFFPYPERNSPCPCQSGKKFKKCCDSTPPKWPQHPFALRWFLNRLLAFARSDGRFAPELARCSSLHQISLDTPPNVFGGGEMDLLLLHFLTQYRDLKGGESWLARFVKAGKLTPADHTIPPVADGFFAIGRVNNGSRDVLFAPVPFGVDFPDPPDSLAGAFFIPTGLEASPYARLGPIFDFNSPAGREVFSLLSQKLDDQPRERKSEFGRNHPFLFFTLVRDFQKSVSGRYQSILLDHRWSPVVLSLSPGSEIREAIKKLPPGFYLSLKKEGLEQIDLVAESPFSSGGEFTLAHIRLTPRGETISALSPDRLREACTLLRHYYQCETDPAKMEPLTPEEYSTHMAVNPDSPKEDVLGSFTLPG